MYMFTFKIKIGDRAGMITIFKCELRTVCNEQSKLVAWTVMYGISTGRIPTGA